MTDEQRSPPSTARDAVTSHTVMEQGSFLLLHSLVTLLFFYLLEPFFSAVFWACVVGILFYPLHLRLLNRWGRPNLAALATLVVCMVVAIVPVLFLMGSFFQEGAAFYQRIESGEINPGQYVDRIRQGFPQMQAMLEGLHIDLNAIKGQLSTAAVKLSQMLAQNAVSIGQNTMQFFISLGIMLYLAFFLLRDGSSLVALLIRALPLGDAREKTLFTKFAEVTRATIKGNLVVAIVQGSLGGLIFWFLDIQAPLLWGVVMTVLSLIPVVGAGLIWVPVAVYLFAIGSWGQGLVLVIFGVAVIGLVDNVLRPVLVGRDTKLPDYVVLLSTLGGFALFGLNGFVLGPLIAVLFVAFWQIFILEFSIPAERAHGSSYPSAVEPEQIGSEDEKVPE